MQLSRVLSNDKHESICMNVNVYRQMEIWSFYKICHLICTKQNKKIKDIDLNPIAYWRQFKSLLGGGNVTSSPTMENVEFQLSNQPLHRRKNSRSRCRSSWSRATESIIQQRKQKAPTDASLMRWQCLMLRHSSNSASQMMPQTYCGKTTDARQMTAAACMPSTHSFQSSRLISNAHYARNNGRCKTAQRF